jgi:hypothetical protein
MPALLMPERENPTRLPARLRRRSAHWRHYLDYSRAHSGRRKCLAALGSGDVEETDCAFGPESFCTWPIINCPEMEPIWAQAFITRPVKNTNFIFIFVAET